MAYANTHIEHSNIRQVLARPFVALGAFMTLLADSAALAQGATQIVEMSDEALEAKGMTRADAIQELFAEGSSRDI